MKYACCKLTTGSVNERITCSSCKNVHHLKCLFPGENFKEISHDLKRNWICPPCSSLSTRRLNSDETPVRSTKTSNNKYVYNDIVNASSEESSKSSPADNNVRQTYISSDEIKSIISLEISKWKSELEITIQNIISSFLNPIREDITCLKESISFINNKYDDMDLKINNLESEVKLLSNHAYDINNLKKNMAEIILHQNNSEQWARRSNIEIYGIPENKNENLMEIFKTICEKSGFPINSSADIDFITRVAPSKTENHRIKPVIVRFLSRWKKDDFLAAVKKLRLKSCDIGFSTQISNIYFNDHLTRFNKKLLMSAKKLAKDNNYTFVWVKNCTIYVRRSNVSPVLHIITENDLKKIV